MFSVKKKLLLFFLSFFLLNISHTYASVKIYIQEYGSYGYGIVAEARDWTCGCKDQIISGSHKKDFTKFIFSQVILHDLGKKSSSSVREKVVMTFVSEYLYKFSCKNKTVFSSVFLSEVTDKYFLVEGSYFNDEGDFGGFALYIQPVVDLPHGQSCLMHVSLRENLLTQPIDEVEKRELYQKAFDLITPINTYK